MALTAADIITRASEILFDETNVRWTTANLLKHVNDAQRAVVNARPDVGATVSTVTLVSGVKQSIPATAVRLLDITRNMGADGLTPGGGIAPANLEKVRKMNPGWAATTASSTVKNFMYDPKHPREFFVFPPVPASPVVQVEGIFVQLPTDCASTSSALGVSDAYGNALLFYVLARAFSKDLEGRTQDGDRYYALFLQELGVKTTADMVAVPAESSQVGS